MADALHRIGLQADALHSDLTQSRREKILSSFRLGRLKILCVSVIINLSCSLTMIFVQICNIYILLLILSLIIRRLMLLLVD